LTVLRSGRDVWGDRLLAARGGPTYAAARRFLPPLLYARGPRGRPLTASGVYYLPFGQPAGPQGTSAIALHVADGSQIVWRRAGGRTLTVFVGARGGERYGSCLARLRPATLAGGWLPILETGYVDAAGARYRQESFATRVGGTLTSFVRVSVAGRRTVRVRLVSRSGSLSYRVPGGGTRTVYAAWSGGRPRPVGATTYDAARASVVAYWRGRVSEGASISVPEPRVEHALRGLLVQELVLTWRYSIGNPYEEFSFPESVDVAQVMAELGFGDVARSILRTSLTRAPTPYPNWKKGERLLATAEEFRLDRDPSFVRAVTPTLRGFVAVLGRQIRANGGLLDRERYSSDIPNAVLGTHSQAVVWAGLRGMADVWAQTGQPALGRTCRTLAARLGGALRRALARSQVRLADGSLFLPAMLLDGERPYRSLTDARLGSYWNLVMPYALASGLFAPDSLQARGVLRYMLLHGSRLLGLVRAGAYALYGRDAKPPVSGTDEVYGINVARFLANEDEPDQLVLSLYGDLAAGMTPSTFVSGEAASVAPLGGTVDRSMYLPPNAASNAAFLETLRVLLLNETPRGLQLAYATPRAWLQPGKRIALTNLPTSFGPLSYELLARSGSVAATVDVPDRQPPHTLSLRLRLPPGERIGIVSVGGRPYSRVDRRTATIDLSGMTGKVTLAAQVERAR